MEHDEREDKIKGRRRTSSCLGRELGRKHNVILDEQVAMSGRTFEMRHALAPDGLYEPGLRDDAIAHERDDVTVQVGQVARETE